MSLRTWALGVCAALSGCATTIAGQPPIATAPFTLDLLGWAPDAHVTWAQRAVAQGYLAVSREAFSWLNQAKVAQVQCVPLPTDLMANHAFFHCRTVFAANAVDGGPFDEGHVIAWDGRHARLHANRDVMNDGAFAALRFSSAEDAPAWRALDAALEQAVAKRLTSPAGDAMPDWLRFLLTVHFDASEFTWRPGDIDPASVTAAQLDAKPEALATGHALASAPGALWVGTATFHAHHQTRAVFLRVELKGGALHVIELTVAARGDVWG